MRRIDQDHTAPKDKWLELGLPQWPTAEQNAQIFDASIMQKEKLPLTRGANGVSFTVELPANGVAAVQVPLGGDTDVVVAQQRRERAAALAEARARMAAAAADVAALEAELHAGSE